MQAFQPPRPMRLVKSRQMTAAISVVQGYRNLLRSSAARANSESPTMPRSVCAPEIPSWRPFGGTLVPNSCPCSRLQQAMARKWGQEDQFVLTGLNAHCLVNRRTFAGTYTNGRGAPRAASAGSYSAPTTRFRGTRCRSITSFRPQASATTTKSRSSAAPSPSCSGSAEGLGGAGHRSRPPIV
jgi:hypothetical protein